MDNMERRNNIIIMLLWVQANQAPWNLETAEKASITILSRRDCNLHITDRLMETIYNKSRSKVIAEEDEEANKQYENQ